MKAGIAVASALFVMIPSAAQGRTTIVEPPSSHFPYQQWVNEAKVPTPPGTVVVIETKRPCGYANAAGCAYDEQIEVARPGPGESQHQLFDHELGHLEDQAILTPAWRARFTRLVGRGGDPWEPFVQEAFADTYSLCARRPDVSTLGKYRIQQARALTPSQLARACRLIRRSGQKITER